MFLFPNIIMGNASFLVLGELKLCKIHTEKRAVPEWWPCGKIVECSPSILVILDDGKCVN